MVTRLEDLAPQGLLDRVRKAADLVDGASRVRVFCHYDPDGTTSAAILTRALMRRGKRIHATLAHALDRSSAARLNEETNELLIVSDECVYNDGKDWPKLVWVVDARVETNPVPVATLPMPPHEAFAKRGGRFGSHNLHENLPVPTSWRSDTIVVGSFFNAGVRAFDVSNPYQPEEVAYFVPGAPKLSPAGAIQLNDVYVDDRGIVFTVDRFVGGLYVLELTL